MVRVIDRIKVAKQALATLEELLDIEEYKYNYINLSTNT